MSKKLTNKFHFVLLCFILLFCSTSQSADNIDNFKIENWIENIPILSSLIENRRDVVEFDSSNGKIISISFNTENLPKKQIISFYSDFFQRKKWKKYENENISSKITPRIYISGRKNLIKRCVNNLIDNAIKYAEKVNVDITKSSNNLFIKIEDNGPGIPEAEYDNVFKPFYKIDKGRAETKSSVGLGLSIASDIIRSHGGNIKLAKSPMGGLEAKIFLPF